MTDFACLSLDEVCDALLAAERPIILSHVRPDGDTVGTAAALSFIFAALGKRAAWDCADPLPRRLAFLFEGTDLATPEENAGGTVIAVDAASPAQLGSLREKYPSVALSIDHHGTGELFAPSLVCPDAAATGEVLFAVAERLIERGALPSLSQRAAAAIYAAISSDTGCFKYANVTPTTHRAAAALLSLDIGADKINHLLYDSRSPSQLAAEKIALSRLTTRHGGKIAAVCLTRVDREGLSEEDFETAVDIARSMAGVEIALAIRELEGGVCKVSLRSTDANVAAVAQSFGGGGHLHAAGCTVLGEPEDALDVLLPSLITALNKSRK
ncbi:MAG: DHH family phosphoesterase [Clostridia bacterium]|nr:DHH family phosphoesterase [Clostridia bacterium]